MSAPTCSALMRGLRRPARLGLILLTLGAGLAQAQGMPGGMPGGKGPGGGPPGGAPSATARPERSLDDLLPPDPWRRWHEQLLLALPSLALSPQQAPLMRALIDEVDLVSQLNQQRVTRATHHRANVVSAVPDISRDLRLESGDARDWMQALDDLSERWLAAAEVLEPRQRSLVDAAYQRAREIPPPTPR